MSTAASPSAPSRAPQPARPRQSRQGTPKLRTEGVSAEARRHAAAILEVLAGVTTPTQAAAQLAISLTRYYIIESRALQGLLAACEPRPRGKVRTPASELAALRRECEQLRRQAARQQALLRVTERAIGLHPTAAATPSAGAAQRAKKRRPRKPKARALQAAAVLQEATAAPGPSSDNGLSP